MREIVETRRAGALLDPPALRRGTVRRDRVTLLRPIAALSRGLTLLPGDLILTGTPAGVGYAREPACFLTDGGEVTVSSPQLSTLTNPVRHTDRTSYRARAGAGV
ncbi:MAG: hypothetical protein GEV28_19085 [Actinophytocola sp.]|nr:hypothetical protein [Actinophytocola sp.]